MTYRLVFSAEFEKQLSKLMRKDRGLAMRIIDKLEEVLSNPLHYKPLRNVLKGYRRVHVRPFVIIFDITGKDVNVHYVKHHDDAY